MRKLIVVSALAATTAVASNASAFEESTRRPFYIQGAVGSFSYWPVLFQNQAYWRPDVEFGYHFSGRHDGFVLGIRQAFDVGRDVYSGGQTSLRAGWDFALPFRNGRFELTLAPYGTLGVNYIFQGPQAGVHASVGFDAKLFFFQGLYVLVRPIELGFGQFVNLGPFAQNVYFNINAGIGVGYAF
jgi:hypothetical protein